MRKFSGGSPIVAVAAIGVLVVGGVLWFGISRDKGSPADVEETQAVLPREETAAATPADNSAKAAETVDETPNEPQETTAPEESSQETAAPEVEDVAVADDPEPEQPKEPLAAAAIAPAFDEVRREEDGMTIIAGTAAPGAQIEILQDGDPVAMARADGGGKFATIMMIPPDSKGHILSLRQVIDSEETASADQIILAPLAPPVQVAEITSQQDVVPVQEAPPKSDDQSPTVAETKTAEETTPAAPLAEEAATVVAEVEEAVVEERKEPVVAEAKETAVAEDGDATVARAEESAEAEAEGTSVAQVEETAVVEAARTADPQVEATAVAEAEGAAAMHVEEIAVEENREAAIAEAEETASTDVRAIIEEPAGADEAPANEPKVPDQTASNTVVAKAEEPAAEPKQPEVATASPEQAPAPQVAPAQAGMTDTQEVAEVSAETEAAPALQVAEVAEDPAPKPEPAPKTLEVAVLKTTKDGVELLNTPRPEVMENVALDTISYSDAGDVQLSGRAQSEARSVQVYLDNNAVVSLVVDAQGRWRGDLPDVDEGIYTLRVDEVAEDGTVTSRVETPFKREDPEVLAEAAAAQDGPLKQITVQKGATLWAIAQDRYGDGLLYVNVFKANADAIRDPDLIYPGQIFALPEN